MFLCLVWGTNGTTEHKHYLSAAGTVFAQFTSRTGKLNGLPASATRYYHKDHLGSLAALTDEAGVVSERLAYDPWGKRRFVNTTPGQPDARDTLVGIHTDRGYTEHEHLDEIDVIHMNGRLYDPLIGRFMSADDVIPDPFKLKSFNRYSYVENNPLVYEDPTGHEAWGTDPEGGSTQYSSSGDGYAVNTYTGETYSYYGDAAAGTGASASDIGVQLTNDYPPPAGASAPVQMPVISLNATTPPAKEPAPSVTVFDVDPYEPRNEMPKPGEYASLTQAGRAAVTPGLPAAGGAGKPNNSPRSGGDGPPGGNCH